MWDILRNIVAEHKCAGIVLVTPAYTTAGVQRGWGECMFRTGRHGALWQVLYVGERHIDTHVETDGIRGGT